LEYVALIPTSFRVWKVAGSIVGQIKSKTEKLNPVASLNVQYLWARAGLVGPVTV